MKRNITLVFILFLLCSPFIAAAQGQRTVEVILSDTVNLKATSFVYKISGGEDNGMYGALASMSGKESGDEGKYSLQIDSAEQLLRENHYHYSFNTENKYALGKSGKPSALMVTLTSEAELDGLCKKLSKIQGLKGKIQNVSYERPDAYLPAMFGRLYADATRQAGTLATISGGAIGKVIAITEIPATPAATGPYESMMSELKKMPLFAAMYETAEGLTQTYTRRMSFRFEMK
jgi:hypothetical protein